jgi:hypothetical protein
MAPPKSSTRSQQADPQNEDSGQDTPATPDPHGELLQQIADQLATANARIAALEAERHQHQQQADHPPKDPKIAPPPEFSGKISEYRNFIAQCTLNFSMRPNTYDTDERKVLFIVSLLRGSALSWARDIVENENHQYRNDYPAFKTAMSNIYLDQNYRQLCENKLNALHQTKSAASYYVEFATLSAPLALNDEALCLNFYRGLHRDVKDDMAIVGRASTYDALVKQAIGLDQRQYQRRIEAKSESGFSSSSTSQNKPRVPANTRANNLPNPSNPPKFNPPKSNPSNPPTPSNAKYYESKPRGPLSEEEKDRRKRSNLCVYCASPKHSIDNCPGIAAKDAKVNILSLPPPRYPPPHPENSNAQAPTRTEA